MGLNKTIREALKDKKPKPKRYLIKGTRKHRAVEASLDREFK